MHTSRLFVSVEAAALLALLAVACAMALLGSGFPGSPGTAFQSSIDAAKFYFLNTLLIGVVPVAAVGAPIYFGLLRRARPRWLLVILLGVAPGLAALILDTLLGTIAMICGVIVAAVTHVSCRRLGPNNSFKPKPLRGSA
jgi:hypothetical protein